VRYKIKYHSIQSDHILAVPQFSHSEIIECDSKVRLDTYIRSQKDEYGHHYKKGGKQFGFDYTSNAGGVKVKPYRPKVKKI
jgi:hypothetical protein